MKRLIYQDNETGEITDDHGEAMKWFREGHNIKLILDGENYSSWEW